MSNIIDLKLEIKTAILLVSGNPWQIIAFNQTAQTWFNGKLKKGNLLSSVVNSINEKALNRRLSKGRNAQFDYHLDLDHMSPIEFTCSLTNQIEGGVIIEGHELTRAHSAELMLSSYSHMIEEKNQELEAAIQARDQFFATMSHELRTPLNSIIGFTESLLDEIYGELNDEQMNVLKKVYGSGHSLMLLLTNLLNLSRIRSGKLELNLKSIDLQKVCLLAVESQREALDEKSIEILFDNKLSEPCEPLADEEWCLQMVEHLLNNAIKFSPKKGVIGINVHQHPQGVRITVWDNGIGIPLTHQSRIFQPFTQVESSLNRAYDGSGLGLSVVSEIISLHGGQISVESKEGIGSKFHLDFVCEC